MLYSSGNRDSLFEVEQTTVVTDACRKIFLSLTGLPGGSWRGRKKWVILKWPRVPSNGHVFPQISVIGLQFLLLQSPDWPFLPVKGSSSSFLELRYTQLMASSMLCNSVIHSSSPLLSRTQFIIHPSKEHPADLSPHSVPYSLSSRTRSSYWNRGRKQPRPVSAAAEVATGESPTRKLRILVAGGGIGGLVFALAAKRKGFEVVVFEKDLSAIRGEGQYRGPIQIQSNALAALEAIQMDVAEEVMRAGCITGDRINGLVDGVSGNW